MDLKAIKIVGVFVIFLLCFPFHFIYDFMPNSLFSIFFPVNESIWEHMKLILTSYYVYSILEFFLFKRKNIAVNNFLLNVFLTPILGISLYLLIYLPLFNLFGEQMFISIGLLFFIIIFEQIFSYLILTFNEIFYQNIIGFIGIIITIIIFGYLTYNPFLNDLFIDHSKNQYGINYFIK